MRKRKRKAWRTGLILEGMDGLDGLAGGEIVIITALPLSFYLEKIHTLSVFI